MKKLFTPEELEELRRADAEIDESFRQTQEEIRQSRARDRQAQLAAMEPEKRTKAILAAAYREANREKVKARRAAYYQANREKEKAYQAAYYQANREKVKAYQAAYREANREKEKARQREYRARKRAASGEANSEGGKEKI